MVPLCYLRFLCALCVKIFLLFEPVDRPGSLSYRDQIRMLKGVSRHVGGLCAGFIVAFSGSTASFAVIHEVAILDGSFSPAQANVIVGDTVRWVHQGTGFHTTTSTTGLWDSSVLLPGESFDYTFSDPGIYNYTSTTDTGMNGRIVVERGYGVNIISPGQGSRFNPGDNVNVQLSLSDPDALVTEIVLNVLHSGATTTLTNQSTNLVFTITNIVEGLHRLTATAYGGGTNRASTPITIAVGDVNPNPTPDTPVITNVTLTASFQMRFIVLGTSGVMHEILASPTVDTNASWTVVGSGVPVDGKFEYTDPAAVVNRRFYRVRAMAH